MRDDEPPTGELRSLQSEREDAERRQAQDAPTDEDTRTHQRRADKAGYLEAKLRERAQAEAEAEAEGDG